MSRMMTEKEVAQRIRNFLKDCNDLRTLLTERGFKVTPIPSPDDFEATKTVETSL